MRKFLFLLVLTVCSALALVSCDPEQENNDLIYSVDMAASGNGYLNASVWTGHITLEGEADVNMVFRNDTVDNFVAPMDAPVYGDVMANPANYSNEVVDVANRFSANIDSMSGEWAVDITGYVSYKGIYLIIDEHWPAAQIDTIPVDSITVTE